MTHPYFEGANRPRVFAHRGLVSADGSVWENTALAFAAADAAGAEYAESDCRVTADGDVVLFHDATLQRLFSDARPVKEVSTAELRALFANNGGLLTLGEALESFPRLRWNIDVKSDDAAVPAGRDVAPHAHRVLLTSFSDARRRRSIASALQRGADHRPASSGGTGTVAALWARAALRLPTRRILRDIDAVQIPERQGPVTVLTKRLLTTAQKHAIEVHVWTVNDPSEMRRLVDKGVDGIVTDRTDVAVEVLLRKRN